MFSLRSMEIAFSPEAIILLQQAAARYGKTPEQYVEDTMTSVLSRRAEFLDGVERGIAAADRGHVIEHDEAMRRLDSLFQS